MTHFYKFQCKGTIVDMGYPIGREPAAVEGILRPPFIAIQNVAS